ncbi:hypothetical protein IV53_GL000514 [Ligilactobacillus ceti DSM 22408]|uniref:Uncharacterized protein n=2 Tax=Ligilactobacillus TaxID=2767887 RepID=A0A0R2KM58_9LACO|nr:hypothetical protein IV53_GL000514 [Ligilactobacillus ceti DSM 22408]
MYPIDYAFDKEIPELDIVFPDVKTEGLVGTIELPPGILAQINVAGDEGYDTPASKVEVVNPAAWLKTDAGEDITVNGYNLKDLTRKGYEAFKDDLKEYKLT